MMQLYKRFHQSQTDTRTAGSTLSLEEAFKDLISLILRDTLARIFHIKTEIGTFIFQRYKDFATSRRIFQGIAQQIEHDTGNLLLIGNHFMAAFQVINIQMQSDLLALGSKLEVAHPHRQGLHNVEAIEFQFHLAILNLTEIKNVTY